MKKKKIKKKLKRIGKLHAKALQYFMAHRVCIGDKVYIDNKDFILFLREIE